MIFKKEKEVIELIIKHADKMEECLSTAIKTLQAYLQGNISDAKKLARQTDQIELEADKIRHQIKDKLFFGAYLPLIREDIYKLVECIDTVANSAEKCCDFFLNQRPDIPEDLKSQFITVGQEAMSVAAPLKKAVMCFLKKKCTIRDVRHYAQEVGLIESDVDRSEWDLTKAIYISSLDFSHKIHLKHCLDKIVEVSDRAEDAADQLELAALKSMA